MIRKFMKDRHGYVKEVEMRTEIVVLDIIKVSAIDGSFGNVVVSYEQLFDTAEEAEKGERTIKTVPLQGRGVHLPYMVSRRRLRPIWCR